MRSGMPEKLHLMLLVTSMRDNQPLNFMLELQRVRGLVPPSWAPQLPFCGAIGPLSNDGGVHVCVGNLMLLYPVAHLVPHRLPDSPSVAEVEALMNFVLRIILGHGKGHRSVVGARAWHPKGLRFNSWLRDWHQKVFGWEVG